MSGHPSTTSLPTLAIVADVVHLISMSVWLGGLVLLAAFLLPRATAAELSSIVPVWSRWATYAVAALIVTGSVQTVVEVSNLGSLPTTRYGVLLLTKIGLVGVVLAVAFFSRRQVAPIAAGSAGTAPATRLRRLVTAEAAVAGLVLAIASVLVQTTPTRSIAERASTPTAQPAFMQDPLYDLSVDIQPAKVSPNDIHLYASNPDGQPATIQQWVVRAALPAQGIEPIEAQLLPITPDHAVGQITLPAAGVWTFTFTLRTTEIDQSTVSAQFTVAD